MHSPSPQLLRALRASISPRPSISSILPTHHRPNHLLTPLRHNSNNITRPARILPRAHPQKPRNVDRDPEATERTETDIGSLNVLGSVPAPATAIDTCLDSGFQFNNGVNVTGGDGVLLVNGEAFSWRPWLGASGYGAGAGAGAGAEAEDKKALMKKMVNAKGQFEVDEAVWGLLGLVWPRPDLLIVGTGLSIVPLSLETRRHINSHGVRVEVVDTRNAAAQFNLLATERGVSDIAAALIPIGWPGR